MSTATTESDDGEVKGTTVAEVSYGYHRTLTVIEANSVEPTVLRLHYISAVRRFRPARKPKPNNLWIPDRDVDKTFPISGKTYHLGISDAAASATYEDGSPILEDGYLVEHRHTPYGLMLLHPEVTVAVGSQTGVLAGPVFELVDRMHGPLWGGAWLAMPPTTLQVTRIDGSDAARVVYALTMESRRRCRGSPAGLRRRSPFAAR